MRDPSCITHYSVSKAGVLSSILKGSACIFISLVAISSHALGSLQLRGDFTPGGLVRGKAIPGAEVNLGMRKLRVSRDGWFVFGFGLDAKPRTTLTINYPDGRTQHRTLQVTERRYQKQIIDGLPQNKVSPTEKNLERIRRENDSIARARLNDRSNTDFLSEFQWPVSGKITGVFGSQRILNGQPRRPHTGVDIAAPTGVSVKAPVAGLVSLVNPDMYLTGGTVILDHGHGVSSVFAHLSKIYVKQGDLIQRGEIFAEVGATGRATGPHLHWGVNWFGERLDPELLVDGMP